MLASIILFLALVSLAFTILKYRIAIFEATKRVNLSYFFISSIVTAVLFSYLFYLTH